MFHRIARDLDDVAAEPHASEANAALVAIRSGLARSSGGRGSEAARAP